MRLQHSCHGLSAQAADAAVGRYPGVIWLGGYSMQDAQHLHAKPGVPVDSPLEDHPLWDLAYITPGVAGSGSFIYPFV